MWLIDFFFFFLPYIGISYWKHEAGPAGFAKEVGGAVMTGGVANTGALRQMQEHEIQQARTKA